MNIEGVCLPPWTKRAGIAVGALAVLAPLLLSTSCSTPDDPVYVGAYGTSGGPSLGGADASAPETSTPNRLLCDTVECPAGRMTCPGDRFPCAVDLMQDDLNCGACGNACPGAGGADVGTVLNAKWTCVDGRCTMQCSGRAADCNGIVDDGCEASLDNDARNCGSCGNECTAQCWDGLCDCAWLGPQAKLCSGSCVRDPQSDDANCGSCGNECTLSELDPSWNAYVGCLGGACNQRKCQDGAGDCNNDLQHDDGDGCETVLIGDDRNNCGGCGVRCKDAEICINGSCFGCRPGETLCDPETSGVYGCFVLTSDRDNCGGCAHKCPQTPLGSPIDTHGLAACVEGVCSFACEGGFADCDGNRDNGCEVNIRRDPENCGACGDRCPLSGQACIEGQCVKAPCDSEVPR